MPGHQPHDSAFIFSPRIAGGENTDLPCKPLEVLIDSTLLGRLLRIIDEGRDNGTGNGGGVENSMAIVGRTSDENMGKNVADTSMGWVSSAERMICVILMKERRRRIPREKLSFDVIGHIYGVMVNVAVPGRTVSGVGSEGLGEDDRSGRADQRFPAKDDAEKSLEMHRIVDGTAELFCRQAAILPGRTLRRR